MYRDSSPSSRYNSDENVGITRTDNVIDTIPAKMSGSLDLTTNLLFKHHFPLNEILKFPGAKTDKTVETLELTI